MAVGWAEGLRDRWGTWPGTMWIGAEGSPRCCLGAPEQRFHWGFGPQIPSRWGCASKSLLGTYLRTKSTAKAQLWGRGAAAFPKLTTKLISISIEASWTDFNYTPSLPCL